MKPASFITSIAALSVCSCASIVSKSNWPVTVTSTPPGAKVTITNDRNGQALHVAETPTTVTLRSGAGFFRTARYKVEYSRPGFAPTTSYVSADMNGWYAGNIVFGGLIGLLIVDPATGAMFRLPSEHYATLVPTRASLDSKANLYVTSIDKVPLHLRSQLERMN
jgi:hypothetical protein